MNNIDVQDVEVPGAAGRVQRFGHQLSNRSSWATS
jgi:hypothetical protein